MAVSIGGTVHIYSIKYLDKDGRQGFHDQPASGTSDAWDRFLADNPDCKAVSIHRKS